ncbi:MAG TPA: T9SS type A sorting domain-containing protein [Bacteroidales bacterium]|nr:T9SS type A sorting domain-containing protein [Bacteroidales bacterium]
MKQAIFFIVVLFVNSIVYSQTVEFNYDNSGNRTSRTTITLKSTSGTQSGAQSAETFEDKVGENSILIYPNPVQSEITVEIQGLEESSDVTISLFNQGGQLILSRERISNPQTLNLAHLPSGAYFLIIRIEGKNTKWQIVKE